MKDKLQKKYRWVNRSALLVLLTCLATQIQANMSYREYYPLRDSEDMMVYVWGVGKGLSWGNTMLENSGRRMLYCAPNNFNVTAQSISQVITQEAAFYDDTQLQQVTIEQLVVMGLIRAFPCQGGGRQ